MGHVSEMVGTMSTKLVTVQEAEGHLLELIALVEQGEEVVITYDDQPKVKLVPIVKPPRKRVVSQFEF
jgi:antitoxin (DNA-binding transcriptional repressor) of toxin-antitoxin stability system